MTDPTIALLRALARGGTMADLAAATGLTERVVRGRLRRLEEDGIELVRPPPGPWGPGQYRLADPGQVLQVQREGEPRRA